MTPTLCGARKKQGEGTCRLVAGHGTDHPGVGACKFHGGSTTAHRLAAARVTAAAQAAKLGAEAALTPAAALTWAIELVGGEARFRQAKVAELEAGQIEGDRLHPLAVALSQTAERLARVSKLGVDADLEGKRLALDALVLDRISGAIAAAITDAGLSAEDTDRLKAALGDRFRELAAADAETARLTA
jgi:hypothetical protein